VVARDMWKLIEDWKNRVLREQPIWVEVATENPETAVLQAACAMACA